MKLKRHSLTLWFNGVLGFLVLVGGAATMYLPQMGLDPVIASRTLFGVAVFTYAANMWLRYYKTTEGLK